MQVADASSLNSGHARGRLHTPKPFPRFVEHIIALLLRKMMKRRRMWKDRLLFVPFDYNLYSVSAGACRSALLSVGGPSRPLKAAMGMDVHAGRGLTRARHQPELLHRFFQLFLLDVSS